MITCSLPTGCHQLTYRYLHTVGYRHLLGNRLPIGIMTGLVWKYIIPSTATTQREEALPRTNVLQENHLSREGSLTFMFSMLSIM